MERGRLFTGGSALFTPQNMTQLVIFLAAQQHAGEDIIDFPAVGIRQANHHFGEEIRVQIVIHMLFPVCGWVEQLGAAALLKLQVKQNDVRRVEVIGRQFEEDVVCLLKRLVFGQAVV